MKRKLIYTTLLLCFSFAVKAQIVSDRTNRIHLDFTGDSISTTLPSIEWEYPRQEFTNTTENRVEIKADVSGVFPLKSVKLVFKKTLNGSELAVREEYVEKGALSVTVQKNIYLQDGQNYVEVVAEDENGGIVKEHRSIIVGMDAISDAIAIDRKDYAVLFATDKYDNWGDLVNPVYDANTIAKELEEAYGFDVRVVENVTQDQVFTILREYAQINYKPQDQLFIFFAGHGQYDETFGEGYVVAKNSLTNDPGKVSYISHNRLRNNINNIPCDHIFLMMDVCFGGTFDPVLASSRATYEEMDNTEFIIRKLSTRTRKYMTSGGKEYVSDGIKGEHSPFAKKFLEALRTQGGEDRILTIAEMTLPMQKLKTVPRSGPFGDDEQGSEFLFIHK